MVETRTNQAGASTDPSPPVRVVQFTDTHLYAEARGTLAGLNTESSLRACVDLARRQNPWPPELIVATGDLVHDSSPSGYQRLAGIFNELEAPIYPVAGNHDDPEMMAQWLIQGNVKPQRCVYPGAWQIVLLDSHLPGSDAGALSEQELDHLDSSLRAYPERHALICLHHPPVDVGSQWMDTMKLQNPEAFFGVLDRHPQVRGVLWGHVHQDFRSERRGVQLIASPSTCVQFAPGSGAFAVDDQPPGYRWLDLHSDGRIETEVIRLPSLPASLDLQSAGY